MMERSDGMEDFDFDFDLGMRGMEMEMEMEMGIRDDREIDSAYSLYLSMEV